ncbi:PREDICTED: breast cancer anti-estrogen resistance protein 3-like [Thamnophis sirtalis]|uniref:Breast cancer anti-estrogen resistance protein 3-like n=1 Tax=Thamnophis sirtalis TaxID=35019 RepID=A0A6I9YWJ1_9SAUR|nr:PREDICTED: breast cancer anti-estrogen resistance protein 3-like [Thamnophis sirtalis]
MLMSDYCELVPKVPQEPRSHVERLQTEERWRGRARITETAFGFLDSVEAPSTSPQSEETGVEPGFERPLLETPSSFQPQDFNSLLLAPNNKPLDPGTLKHLKDIFATHDCHTTALHILKTDCQVRATEDNYLPLITLFYPGPAGITVGWVVVGGLAHISGAGSLSQSMPQNVESLTKAVRAALFMLLSRFVNLQIARLEQTWRHLRQSHTASAIVYEKELKPLLGNLNRAEEKMTHHKKTANNRMGPLCGTDLRLRIQLMFSFLRPFLHSGFQSTPELLEVFQTEFSLRLFWGCKGAQAERRERHKKFERILTVLSQKLE